MEKETKINKIMSDGDIQRIANLSFWKVAGIGSSLFLILGFLGMRLYSRLQPFLMTLIGRLEMICGCQNYFVFSNHPYIFISLIASGGLLSGLFLYVGYRIFKLKRNTNRFIKNILKNKIEHSPKLNNILKELSLSDHVVEFEGNNIEVFCYGLFNPRICISTKMVDMLDKQELKSVLLHEKHHFLVGEPTKLFFIKIISRALFFMPGYKEASDRYVVLSELAADSYAICEMSNKVPLITALYKVISHKKDNIENQLAVSRFQIVTEDRVNGLSDGLHNIKLNIISPTLILGLVLFFTFSFTFNATALSDSKTMSHISGECAIAMPIDSHECQMDEVPINDCDLEYSSINGVC